MQNNDCCDKDLYRLWVRCVGAKLDTGAQLLVFEIICGGVYTTEISKCYIRTVSSAVTGHVHS